jgi:hypothetical protein
MTVATKMTPEEFLKSRPMDHPDFVGCDQETGHPRVRTVSMPNLVALIRRMGGPDAIPDQMEQGFVNMSAVAWSMPDGEKYGAYLRDCKSHRIYAELSRLGPDNLIIEAWHPRDDALSINISLPADWSAGIWEGGFISIQDVFSKTTELDALVMASCDLWLGLIQAATETYCLIRRDVFIP